MMFRLRPPLLAACVAIAGMGLARADDPGPNAPAAASAKPAPEPRPDLTTPEGRKKALDDLFAKLAKSEDDRDSGRLAGAIQRVWRRSGSDTADLLMSRAGDAMKAKDWNLGQEVLDKVIAILPDWAEAWNQRATARFSADDFAGSIEDVAHVLALEPRHFGALSGLGFMFQKMDMKKEALRAFRKTLEVYPRQAELRKIADKLALEVDGQNI